MVALFCAAGLVSVLIEIYFSYVGDSVEVQRHLVGSLLRLSVFLVVTIAIGADSALRVALDRGRSSSRVAAPATETEVTGTDDVEDVEDVSNVG
jgi:hypothetical protein